MNTSTVMPQLPGGCHGVSRPHSISPHNLLYYSKDQGLSIWEPKRIEALKIYLTMGISFRFS